MLFPLRRPELTRCSLSHVMRQTIKFLPTCSMRPSAQGARFFNSMRCGESRDQFLQGAMPNSCSYRSTARRINFGLGKVPKEAEDYVRRRVDEATKPSSSLRLRILEPYIGSATPVVDKLFGTIASVFMKRAVESLVPIFAGLTTLTLDNFQQKAAQSPASNIMISLPYEVKKPLNKDELNRRFEYEIKCLEKLPSKTEKPISISLRQPPYDSSIPFEKLVEINTKRCLRYIEMGHSINVDYEGEDIQRMWESVQLKIANNDPKSLKKLRLTYRAIDTNSLKALETQYERLRDDQKPYFSIKVVLGVEKFYNGDEYDSKPKTLVSCTKLLNVCKENNIGVLMCSHNVNVIQKYLELPEELRKGVSFLYPACFSFNDNRFLAQFTSEESYKLQQGDTNTYLTIF